MGRTRLLLPREASAGGSKEGALVLGCGGHFRSLCGPWIGAGSRLLCLAGAVCCWHKATEAGISSYYG